MINCTYMYIHFTYDEIFLPQEFGSHGYNFMTITVLIFIIWITFMYLDPMNNFKEKRTFSLQSSNLSVYGVLKHILFHPTHWDHGGGGV